MYGIYISNEQTKKNDKSLERLFNEKADFDERWKFASLWRPIFIQKSMGVKARTRKLNKDMFG